MDIDPFMHSLYILPEHRMAEEPTSRAAIIRATLDEARATTDPARMEALVTDHFFGTERRRNLDRGIDVGIIFAAEEALAMDGVATTAQTRLHKRVAEASEQLGKTLDHERPAWSFVQAHRFGATHAQTDPSRLVHYQVPNPLVGAHPELRAAITTSHYNSLVEVAQSKHGQQAQEAVEQLRPDANAALRLFSEHDHLSSFLHGRLGRVMHTSLAQATAFNFLHTPESDGANLVLFTALASKLGSLSAQDMFSGRTMIQEAITIPTGLLLHIDT